MATKKVILDRSYICRGKIYEPGAQEIDEQVADIIMAKQLALKSAEAAVPAPAPEPEPEPEAKSAPKVAKGGK